MAGQYPPQGPHGPMDRMGRWDDPELADIFRDDADLYELARTVRASRPEPMIGPHFEPYLRARLMDAAARELRPRGLSRWLRPRAGLLAGGGAALGVAMIAAVVVTSVMYHPNDTQTVAFRTNVSGQTQVDPNDVIRVSFSEAVDHSAIEHNLQIHPATAVQTRWEGTTLVITPLHHLAANTPYTVTIPHTAVRTSSGHNGAVADIHITFGTASTPIPSASAAPATPPTLQPQQLGAVTGDSRVVIGPNGLVVATSGLVVASSSPGVNLPSLPAPTAAPAIALPSSPTVRPGHGQSTPATSAPTASASPLATTSKLLQLGGPNGPVILGPAATTAAFSANGRSLAYLVARGDVADLWLAHADGSNPTRLVRGIDPASPLAWSGPDSLVYLNASEQVTTVDLEGRTSPVAAGVQIGEGQDLAFTPDGQVAYVGPVPAAVPSATPAGDATESSTPSGTPSPEDAGHLVNLTTGAITPLQGVRQLPAFSADGKVAAWVDESGATPVIDAMPADGSASPTTVPTPAGNGDTLGNLALDGGGTRIAYTLAHGDGGTPALTVATVSSGSAVAVGDGGPFSSPVLSPAGDHLAFLRATSDGLVAAQAVIPGTAPTAQAADAVPADAETVLEQFVDAQRRHDMATLHSLAAGSLTVDSSLAPAHVDRTYIIKAALDTATQTVVADVRLVHDASGSAPPSYADETLKLARPAPGQAYQVTVAAISGFAGAPEGPQVVHVSSERQQTTLVVRIAFDSDLDPSTVTSSVITLSAGNVTLPADVRYDVETRTAVIRVLDVGNRALSLTVGASLRDIAGQVLAGGYTTMVQG